MELTADQLRAIILAEAQKIENEEATRLEEEAVSLDIETLRAIIQEEAQLFEEGYKMSEMDVYEEGDVDFSEGHGDDHAAGMMDEESFAKEMMHDRMDIHRLRDIRDALNAHIHNLEMQDDRAHDHRRHMHEEELPAELSEEEADESHCGGGKVRMEEDMEDEGAYNMEEEMIDEDAGQKATEKFAKGESLNNAEREAMLQHMSDKLGKSLKINESVEAENLNESAAPSNPAVSRWMQIAGL
tara:strand:+ start:269 stop:994 length:726 start_codon:yes stop_codon:yes gene_type:complete